MAEIDIREKEDSRKFGALTDLIAGRNKSVFHTYKPKDEIGKKIFRELYLRFQADPSKGKTGFYMDDSKEIGILSQCQSLQALLTLASDFDLLFDDDHIISENSTNLTIRQMMDMVIEDVLDRVKTSEPGVYVFDASPYETQAFTAEYSNVEAMTWVIPCFLQALKYHARIGENCKWQEQLVDVITYALRYINDSFIENEREGVAKALTIGWNFTKDCQEPSLYYSFTVCECFVDFFNSFEEYLTYKEKERADALEDGDKAAYEKSLGEYESRELRQRYLEINEGIDAIDGSHYGMLESKCKRVAREIWRLCKDNLADEFYYNDLHTTLSEEDINMATTSDALFNTVYIINIMIDAGMDEDLSAEIDKAVLPEDKQRAEDEFNSLIESCQMAHQRAFRVYEKLKKTGKEYIVEQFLVGFNENFTTHKDLVKDLRKRRMRVFTLMPLLIRTNNVMGEYLVKYPQANMRKYLGYILDNRYLAKDKRGGRYRWIWEKDGYFSCSNYYYVAALGEFYSYYERFESVYIEHYNDNEKQRALIIAEERSRMKKPTGDIGKLNKEIADRDRRIAELEAQLASVETPVEDAVAGVVIKEMKRALPELLCNFLFDAAKGLTVPAIDPTECNEYHAKLAEGLKALLIALISDNVQKALRLGTKKREEQLSEYATYVKHISEDVEESITSYISIIKNSPDHRSKIVDSDKGE